MFHDGTQVLMQLPCHRTVNSALQTKDIRLRLRTVKITGCPDRGSLYTTATPARIGPDGAGSVRLTSKRKQLIETERVLRLFRNFPMP